MKKLIVFDLDGTLAESKSSLDAEMSALLHDLLGIVKVAVISGGDWPQFDIGKAQFDLTDFQSASGSFEADLRKKPDDGRAAFFLAETNARLGDWEKARHYYDYALAHNYVDGATYCGMGTALVELADFESAIPPLQRALAMQPSLIHAHFQLAKVYRRLGHMEDAGREARLFAAMNDRIDTSRDFNGPEEESAWKHVRPLLEDGNQEEALKYLATLPGSNSSNPGNSYFMMGQIYFRAGRKDDARRSLMTAKQLCPNDARIAAFLGMVQLSSGETLVAEQSFRSALGLDPAAPLALIGMGGLRYHQGRWQDAIEYLEESRTADPDALFLLCDAYFKVGKPDEARLTVEVIRALGSDRKPLLDEVEKLVRLHEADRSHPVP